MEKKNKMTLIIERLEPEQIQTTITNIRNSPNELVKKVLAEETTYKRECENLKNYNEEEFYQRRDELVDALNHYTFNDINEDEKKLDYELFHKERKKLKQKIKKWKRIGIGGLLGGLPGGVGAFITGCALCEPITLLIGCIAMILSPIALKPLDKAEELEKIARLEKIPPKKFLAMKTYYILKDKSAEADRFMEDIQLFKKHSYVYKNLNEDSDSTYYKSEDSDS